jgi:hypothetical protein
MQVVFLPLWWIDMQLVHKSDQVPHERYPINTKLDDELQKRLKQLEQNKSMQATPNGSPDG